MKYYLLILIPLILLFGCTEDPIDEMKIQTPKTSLEKAQEDMMRVNDRREDVHQKAEISGDFSVLFTAADQIFIEELGFEKEFWQDLIFIWEEVQITKYQAGELDDAVTNRYEHFFNSHTEKFIDMTLTESYFDYIGAYDEIIIDYLRLSYEFPDSSKADLLKIFTESIEEGNVDIQYPEGY